MSVRFTLSARSIAVLAGFALTYLWAMPALACELRLGTLVASQIAYDPFGPTAGDGTIRTTVELVSDAPCEGIVALVDDAAAPLRTIGFGAAGRGLSYRVELQPGDGVQPSISSDTAAVRLDASRRRVTIVWRLLIDGDAVIPAGDYTRVLRAVLRTPDTADQSSALTTLQLRSIARAQANFAGTSSGFGGGTAAQTIDFGTLTTGEERGVTLQIRANTIAHLAIASRNLGYMVGGGDGSARIRYQLALDGTPIDLAAPTTRSVAPPPTIEGMAVDLRVRIGDVAGQPAGRYSDTITIDVSP